jgi:hypothetical protein
VPLNEFVLHTKKDFTVTASAFTQARQKLKHTAFLELNNGIVTKYYEESEIKRFHRFRITAFDASIITLPSSKEFKAIFGSRAIRNHTDQELGDYSRMTFEACYDVLNNIAIKCLLGKGDAYEADLAAEMLGNLNNDDLAIFDRGYACYPLIAKLIAKQQPFIIRCPKVSFKEVEEMFYQHNCESKVVTLKVPAKHAKKLRLTNLPLRVTVKLVRVILPSEEVEVLMTSLIGEDLKQEDFKNIYNLRWGIETFFGKLKGRLALENFTGTSLEAVLQDFWSTIFMSNLETILTEDMQEELNNANTKAKLEKTVNKAISFNAIKNMAFEIFANEQNPDVVLAKLTQLFAMNVIVKRPARKVKRCKISDTRSLKFQKKVRKHVF